MPAADGTHPTARPKRWDASGDQTELTISAGGHVGEAKIELGYEYQPCPDLEPGGVTRSNSSRLKPPGAQVRVPAVPARTRAGPRAPAGGGGSRCCRHTPNSTLSAWVLCMGGRAELGFRGVGARSDPAHPGRQPPVLPPAGRRRRLAAALVPRPRVRPVAVAARRARPGGGGAAWRAGGVGAACAGMCVSQCHAERPDLSSCTAVLNALESVGICGSAARPVVPD